LLGKLFDLETIATVVPKIGFCIALVLLYVLVNRLRRAVSETVPTTTGIGRFVDAGHLIVALLGANAVFFKATSVPYTEAMAFTFLFAALIAAGAAAEQRSVRFAALAGGLAAVAFLTRTQMIGVLLAIPFVFGIVGLRERELLKLAGVTVAAAGLVILPWVVWVASWADITGWRTFVGQGSIRETDLTFFRQTVSAPSAGRRLGQIWQGLSVAFSPTKDNSYVASFGPAVYAVPLALVAVFSGLDPIKRLVKRAASAEGCLILLVAVATLVMLGPLHLEKRQFFRPWLFSWRHGLPIILLVAVAVTYLLANTERLGRALALLLVGASLYQAVGSMQTLLSNRYAAGPQGPEAKLAAWLDAQQPRPRVITTHSQILSSFSRSYFHWADCKVSPKHTRALLESGAADYVLVYPHERRCSYFAPLQREMQRVKRFKRGIIVELWAPKVPRFGAQLSGR
jgi:hypothetical protein